MTTNITKKNTLDILILAQLIKNEEFRGIVFPYLTEKYFEDRFIKVTFKEIQSFINKYHYVPTKEALLISFQNNSNIRIFNEDDKKTLYDVINDGIYGPQKETYKIDWLLEVTEDFCRKKAIYNALTTSIEIHSGLTSSKELGIDAIPSILSEALSISFNKKIGVDYFSDDEERYDFYGSQETGILTDIDYFNNLTNGIGFPRKSFIVFVGGTGVGKTLVKCHFAASAIKMGYNVLYLTMEMAAMRIAQRIDANLLGINYNSIPNLSRDDYLNKIRNLRNLYSGQLIIKEFPTGLGSTSQFRYLTDDLQKKKNFKPDLILVDYLNICASDKYKAGSSATSYTTVKSISEELRAYAVDMDAALLSSTQINRGNLTNPNLGFDGVSESIGVPFTADMMVVMYRDEKLDALNTIQFLQLKNRYNEINQQNKKFECGIIRPQFRLLNKDGQPFSSRNDDYSFESLKDDNEVTEVSFKGRIDSFYK